MEFEDSFCKCVFYRFKIWEKILLILISFVKFTQVKSVKTGSVFWAACTSLSYFYMVSKMINPLHPNISMHSLYISYSADKENLFNNRELL